MCKRKQIVGGFRRNVCSGWSGRLGWSSVTGTVKVVFPPFGRMTSTDKMTGVGLESKLSWNHSVPHQKHRPVSRTLLEPRLIQWSTVSFSNGSSLSCTLLFSLLLCCFPFSSIIFEYRFRTSSKNYPLISDGLATRPLQLPATRKAEATQPYSKRAKLSLSSGVLSYKECSSPYSGFPIPVPLERAPKAFRHVLPGRTLPPTAKN